MVKIGLSKRKKYAILSLLLVFTLLELYAHTYVQVNALPVVSEDQAYARQVGPGDSFKFFGGKCEWVFAYTVERPADNSHKGYIWVYIFKIGENQSLLSGPTSLSVSNIRLSPVKDVYLDFDPKQQIIYNNSTELRLDFDFQGNGTYQLHLNFKFEFYQKTIIGIMPVGQVNLPIDTTVVAFKNY